MPSVTLPDEMPSRMKRLRLDDVGRPVPFFVAWVNDKPDFRLMDSKALVAAVRDQLCFICGERLNRAHRGSNAPKGTFVAGPMCLVNGTSAEPPNHEDCATWSARACPFLTKPAKVRREGGIPEGFYVDDAAGFAIKRNPGVTALITSQRWRLFHPHMGGDGVLFNFTDVTSVSWMSEGRQAKAAEVMTSIETGLPSLLEYADEPGALPELGRRMVRTLRWVGHVDDIDQYPNIKSVLEAT